MGRPTKYTPELAAAICERLAAGESLRAICRGDGMPSTSMVMRWVAGLDEFRERYAQAREVGFDAMAEQALEIADEPVGATDNGGTDAGAVAKQRLQVDTRKWLLAKLAPKKYGEKQAVEHQGSMGLTILTGVPAATDASDLI